MSLQMGGLISPPTPLPPLATVDGKHIATNIVIMVQFNKLGKPKNNMNNKQNISNSFTNVNFIYK